MGAKSYKGKMKKWTEKPVSSQLGIQEYFQSKGNRVILLGEFPGHIDIPKEERN